MLELRLLCEGRRTQRRISGAAAGRIRATLPKTRPGGNGAAACDYQGAARWSTRAPRQFTFGCSKQDPHTSLATVHRTLETLCEIGEARKVTLLHDRALRRQPPAAPSRTIPGAAITTVDACTAIPQRRGAQRLLDSRRHLGDEERVFRALAPNRGKGVRRAARCRRPRDRYRLPAGRAADRVGHRHSPAAYPRDPRTRV